MNENMIMNKKSEQKREHTMAFKCALLFKYTIHVSIYY